jgi:hypothetical protein
MKNFPFSFLGHGIGDRTTFQLYIRFNDLCDSQAQKKIKGILKHYDTFLQLSMKWSDQGLRLLPAVPKIGIWLSLIGSYDRLYRPYQPVDVKRFYKWDSRINFGNRDIYESFNVERGELSSQDRQRLLLNFGVECLLREIHALCPIHWVFYYQGKLAYPSSWNRWSETTLNVIFQEIGRGTLTFEQKDQGQHQFLSNFFSAYLTSNALARMPQSLKEELFDRHLVACLFQPDRHDMKWLMRLNGGDEIAIFSKLSREEIRAIIRDFLIMKNIIKGTYRATAYEPGERALKWLQEAFEDEFKILTMTVG